MVVRRAKRTVIDDINVLSAKGAEPVPASWTAEGEATAESESTRSNLTACRGGKAKQSTFC